MREPVPIEPLSRRRLFQTSELDEARAIVAGKFCEHRLNIASHPGQFDACHHRAEGRSASLNYIRYGADVLIEPGELTSFYLIQIPLAGAADIDNCGDAVQTFVGRGSVLNPHRETKMRWHAGCAQILLQIETQALQHQAEALLGMPLAEPVTFETAVDETRPATAAWVRKLKTCFGLADREAIFGDDNPNTQMRDEALRAVRGSGPGERRGEVASGAAEPLKHLGRLKRLPLRHVARGQLHLG